MKFFKKSIYNGIKLNKLGIDSAKEEVYDLYTDIQKEKLRRPTNEKNGLCSWN